MNTILHAVARHPNPTRKQPRRNASRSSSFKRLALVAALSIFGAARAEAQITVKTWTGNQNNNWANANNWSPSGAPVSSGNLQFEFGTWTSGITNNNISGNFQVNSLSFTNTADVSVTGSNSIQLAQSSVDTGSLLPTINVSGSANVGFTATVNQAAAATTSINSTGGLSFGTFNASGNSTTFTGTGIGNLSIGTFNTGANASTYTFNGAYDATITTVSKGNGNKTWANDLPSGKQLTIGNYTTNSNANNTNTFNGTGLTVITGGISESASPIALVKGGTGTLVFQGTNTYVGSTAVNAGVLNIRNDSALGTSAAGTTVAAGAALQIQDNITVASEALSLAGAGISATGALRNISSTNTYGGPITLTAATRINSDADSLAITGAITGATFGLTVGGAGDTSIASVIGTTTGTLTKDGAGTLTLTGASTFTGATTISNGILSVSSLAGIGTASNIGAGNSSSGATNTASLVLDGGTLQYTGPTVAVTRGFTVNSANGTIDTGANTLTFSGNTAGDGALTKIGAGTLALTGTGGYTGGTTISAGTLKVQPGALAASSAVIVADGSAFEVFNLAGNSVQVDTLAIGSAASSTLNFNFSGDPTASPIIVGSNDGLTTGGTVEIAFANSGGTLTTGLKPLIQYTGSVGGDGLSAFAATPISLPPRIVASIDTATAGLVQLDITQIDTVRWTGAADGNWDTTTNNWIEKQSNNATAYIQGDDVTFDDVGSPTNKTVNLIGSIAPGAITVDTSGGNYTFEGTGDLSGAVGLVKNGAGTLLLKNTGVNSFTGGTTISGGTLQVGDGTSTANLPGSVLNNGALVLNPAAADTITLSGNITGNGTVTVDSGTVVFSAVNTYSGPTNINDGATLKAGVAQSVLAGSATTLAAGATLDLNGFSHNFTSLNAAPGSSILLGDNEATVLAFTGGGTVTVDAVISGSGGINRTTSAGTLILSAQNTYTGNTNIQNGNGIIRLAGSLPNVLPIGTRLTNSNNNNALLDLNGVDQEIAGFGGSTANPRVGNTSATPSIFTVNIASGSNTSNWVLGGGGTNLSLVKKGAGSLLLAKANTYTGGTTIESGILRLSAPAAKLGTGTVTLADGVILGVTNGTVASLDNAITLNGAGSFDTPNAAATLTLNGAISGTGSLTKTNVGTLNLNAASNYDGLTRLAAGTTRSGIDNALPVATSLYIGSATTLTNSGLLDLNGNNQEVADLQVTDSNTGTANRIVNTSDTASVLTVNYTGDTTSTYSGFIGNTGGDNLSLVKDGSGTWRLTGDNTYTGTTTVSAGRLVIDGDNSAATGAVSVAANATLSGSGTLGGLVKLADGAILAPGNSAGSQNFAGGLDLSEGGIYHWELDSILSSIPGTDYDTITVSAGDLTLGGTSTLLIDTTALVGTDPDSGDAFWTIQRTWDIATSGSITGNFASITNGTWASGTFSTSVADGNLSLNFTPVPEPSTFVLGALGGLGFAAWSWRRRFAGRRESAYSCTAHDDTE